jgi:thymidylate kinase
MEMLLAHTHTLPQPTITFMLMCHSKTHTIQQEMHDRQEDAFKHNQRLQDAITKTYSQLTQLLPNKEFVYMDTSDHQEAVMEVILLHISNAIKRLDGS